MTSGSVRGWNAPERTSALAPRKAFGPKAPFVTWGYHHYFHGEMSRETLNRLAPDFPVMVWHRSAHELFLNDAALKLTDRDLRMMDRLIRAKVDAYVRLFERLLDMMNGSNRGEALVEACLASESGRIYVMLAEAAGRIPPQ